MKKNKINLTVIKESDGSFSAIGYMGKNNLDLITSQGNTWHELKEKALETVNLYLFEKCNSIVNIDDINFNFDLPAFLDLYPKINLEVLAKVPASHSSKKGERASGKKDAPNKQLQRILAAVKN